MSEAQAQSTETTQAPTEAPAPEAIKGDSVSDAQTTKEGNALLEQIEEAPAPSYEQFEAMFTNDHRYLNKDSENRAKIADQNVLKQTITPKAEPPKDPGAEKIATETQATLPLGDKKEATALDDTWASRFAALSKREKALRQKEEEMSEEAKSFQAWKKARDAARQNPEDYLKEAGLTYDDLTQWYLNDGKQSSDSKYSQLEQEIKELKAEREREKEEAQVSKKQQAIDTFKGQISQTVNTNPDKYPFVKVFDGVNLAYDVINENYRLNQTVMPIEESLQRVDQYFKEQLATKIRQNKSLQNFVGSLITEVSVESPKPENTQAIVEKPKTTTTLTNSHLSAQPLGQRRPMTREESLNEAARLLRWKE